MKLSDAATFEFREERENVVVTIKWTRMADRLVLQGMRSPEGKWPTKVLPYFTPR